MVHVLNLRVSHLVFLKIGAARTWYYPKAKPKTVAWATASAECTGHKRKRLWCAPKTISRDTVREKLLFSICAWGTSKQNCGQKPVFPRLATKTTCSKWTLLYWDVMWYARKWMVVQEDMDCMDSKLSRHHHHHQQQQQQQPQPNPSAGPLLGVSP